MSKLTQPKLTQTNPFGSSPADGHKTPAAGQAGAHSLAEILSQPQCWNDCLAGLSKAGVSAEFKQRFESASGWLFIGCGSSYYVALAAAASALSLTGRPARAIPASELLLYPEPTLAAAKGLLPILISRSGRTSEVIRAGELLKARNIPRLAITCAPGQPLEQVATATLFLPDIDEQSTVMTRSFTSMLLCLQTFSSIAAGNSHFGPSLGEMAAATAPLVPMISGKIRDFVSSHRFADYVCLGQGPFFGIACEYALKLTEMSLSYAQSFHTLEFRHGPKSIVGPETLLIFLLSETGYAAERELLEEMKSLGGTTLAITNRADSRARADSDLLLELSLDVPELARLAPALVPGQLLGLYTGLQKGLDPDSPRNLSRAVVLDEEPTQAG